MTGDVCSDTERRVGGSTNNDEERRKSRREAKSSENQPCSDGSAVPLVLVLRCGAMP